MLIKIVALIKTIKEYQIWSLFNTQHWSIPIFNIIVWNLPWYSTLLDQSKPVRLLKVWSLCIICWYFHSIFSLGSWGEWVVIKNKNRNAMHLDISHILCPQLQRDNSSAMSKHMIHILKFWQNIITYETYVVHCTAFEKSSFPRTVNGFVMF